MLTSDEKDRLAEIYAPILFLHPDEKFEPMAPERFMRDSAMWANQPVSGTRSSWGDGSHTPEAAFPRDPLIPRGRIGLVASALGDDDILITSTDEDGFRTYQISDEERELFLQNLSWSQGGPELPGAVSPDIPQASAENTFELPGVSPGLPQFWVDIRDQDDIDSIPGGDDPLVPPPGFDTALRSLYPTGFWMLTYRFFFAYHEERLSQCEVHSEEIRAQREGVFHADHLHGSYEGDWQAVSIIVPNPGMPNPTPSPTSLPDVPISPLDLDEDDFPRPDHVGFSRRARGVLTNIGSNILDNAEFMVMISNRVAAGETRFTGNHVRVFVARGTHNMYASPGIIAAPRLDKDILQFVQIVNPCLLTDDLYDFLGLVDDTTEKIGEVVETGKAAGISVAKVVGGAAAGGIFGGPIGAAIGGAIGGIAAAIEAALRDDPDAPFEQPDPPPAPVDVNDATPMPNPDDDAPDYGTVIVPSELLQDLSETFEDEAIAVKPWEGPVRRFVIDRIDGVQPWWEPDGTFPNGYGGLWGARVERDPFSRRSGSKIPPFDAAFVNAVLTT